MLEIGLHPAGEWLGAHGQERLMRNMEGRHCLRPFTTIHLELSVRMEQQEPLEERVIGAKPVQREH